MSREIELQKSIDMQDRKPRVKERIDRVGVEGLKTHLKVIRQNVEFSHLPTLMF